MHGRAGPDRTARRVRRAPLEAGRAARGPDLPGGRAVGRRRARRTVPTRAGPLAKPPVRKLAKDLGVDLATSLAGPARRHDHPRATCSGAPQPAAAPAAAAAPPRAGEVRRRGPRIPVKGVRKATAQAMVRSAFTAPHVTEFVTVDVTRTMKLVERAQATGVRRAAGNPLLLVAKALFLAVRRTPEVNAQLGRGGPGDRATSDYVNLGIAAATPRGLIVPNIKDAGRLTLPELAAALGELVATAREGRTSRRTMAGGTVTITNVGVFGVDTGTPILNPGESAILAFGAIKLQPWVHKGKVKPRQVTTLALSFDHRLVDGELGSKVLADVAAPMPDPASALTW